MSDFLKASKDNCVESLKKHLADGIDIDYQDECGNNALMYAAGPGNTKVIKLLLHYNASVTAINDKGIDALQLAAMSGQTEVVRFLLCNGGDINAINVYQRNALMEACLAGHDEIVGCLLTKDVDIKQTDINGNTALMLASGKGYLGIVKLLLEHKASLTDANNNGYNALLLAAKSGKTEVVEFLIKNSADISRINKFKRNALMESCFMGHTKTVQCLLTKNYNIKQMDNMGNTALLLACEGGHLSVVKLLLNNEASLTDVNNNAYNALLISAKGGHTEVVKFLVEKKINLNYLNKFKRNALMEASFKGRIETVRFLLTQGLTIEHKDKTGHSALMLACAGGHLSVVELLLQKKARLSDRNNYGFNSLLLAAGNGKTEIVKYIFEKSEDPNCTNNFQRNALMEACFMGHTETVQFLLVKNCNLSKRDNNGNTALLLASEKGHLSIVQLILQHQGNLTDVNLEGYNALIKAARGGHTQVVEFLLENNADTQCVNTFQRNALMEACFMGHTETVQILLTKNFNIKQTDNNGNSAFELCFNGSLSFAALDDLHLLKTLKSSDICYILLYSKVLSDGNWPKELSSAEGKRDILNDIVRNLQEKNIFNTSVEQIRHKIIDVLSAFVRESDCFMFEFYMLQKFFEMLCNDMKTKSEKECTEIGKIVADFKFAEFTVQQIRDKHLLSIKAPVFLSLILQNVKTFSNASKEFSKSLAQQGLVEFLLQSLLDMPKDFEKEWTSYIDIAAGILCHLLLNQRNTERSLIQETMSITLKLKDVKDRKNVMSLKLLKIIVDETKGSLFLPKEDAEMLIQGITQAIRNANRSFNDFTVTTLTQCFMKMCVQAKTIFEILASEPLDCIFTVLSSKNLAEQEAAADCLLVIAEKRPGNLKICEHSQIMSLLEKMQFCELQELKTKVISILWLVKREAIIIDTESEIVDPRFPKHWEKSTFLGSGQYGFVYLIKDLKTYTSKEFTLREIEIDDGISSEIKTNTAELNMFMKVRNHRLVEFYGFQMTLRKLYLFFEYMPMGSIRAYAEEQNGLSEKKIQLFTRQILEALHFLHNRNPPIIHSNIKGDNVLLKNENSVKLADLGLSNIVTKSNVPKICTENWLAPEVLNGDNNSRYDYKVDIWSLACTVVEMATKKPPSFNFHPEIDTEKEPKYSLPGSSSQELKSFLNKMFQIDPTKRASAQELINDPYVELAFELQS